MKLLLSKPRGFCAGVVRAIHTVEQAIEKWGAPIYVKHEIVHNQYVVSRLQMQGAVFVEELSEIPEGACVVYSAHGIPPSVREEAKQRRLIEIDATCGLVTKVHSFAKRYAAKGYKILLIGHRNHVEVIGTFGEAPEVTTIIETPQDVQQLQFSSQEKLVYLTQTTLSLDDVAPIIQALMRKYPWIETLPSSSICYATTNRQMALRDLASSADLVLVVGDPQSSNSNRLREVGAARAPKSFLIQCAEQIDPSWLIDVRTIALTAGASTPEDLVQECIHLLKTWGVSEVEEVAYTEEDVFFQLPAQVL